MMDPKDEIKQKTDILELVGEYVALKPSGGTGFKGLCPFHSEKTPSFHVSQDRQNWHCFGCSEGGDCFSFVMKMEGMTFPEALIHLGKKVGVEVRRLPSAKVNTRARMLSINDLAQKFYRKVLVESTAAAAARKYVESRNIPDDLVEQFGIGFAPDQWDTLSSFLSKRGFSDAELVQAGVSMKRKKGAGVIDRFRNRVMIPLRDHHGNTVGFTGRSMPGDDHGPKYMNSPETPVYSKSHIVFGLDLAKRPSRDEGYVVIVEGNLDVVASHKAGVKNIVASSGTALTQDQLELIKRYTSTIVFAFDSDAAGFKAAKKGISLARALGLDVRCAILPDGYKDPDELVQEKPDLWKQLVDKSQPIMQFYISHVTRGKDLKNIDDKLFIEKELLPALGEIQSVVEREHWLQVVADLLKTPVNQLRSSIHVVQSPKKEEEKKENHTKSLSKSEKARRLLFGYAFSSEQAFDALKGKIGRILSDEYWSILYNLAEKAYDSDSQSAQKSYFSRIRDLTDGHEQQAKLLQRLDTSSFMADDTFQDLPPQKVLEYIDHLFSLLESETQTRRREDIARELRKAEAAGDKEAVTRLLAQLSE